MKMKFQSGGYVTDRKDSANNWNHSFYLNYSKKVPLIMN